MDLRKVLIQSRKLPAQDVERLWESIYKHNVKAEILSSILAFYQHHRVYPPPVQRAFDSLLIAFTGAKVPRKLRTLLFQTVEEMCHWLSPSCVKDTVKLSMSPSVVAGLLPCFLINKDIPLPSHNAYEWLIGSLTSPGLCLEDRARVLRFLMTTLPGDLTPSLNKQLILWLSYSRSPQTTSGLFRSADVTELDGSSAVGICTAFTLVSSISELHYLSLVAFSGIRKYLRRTRDSVDTALVNAVCSYCSTLLAQAGKRPTQPHDKLVVAATLEEVVMVLAAVGQVDPSSSGKCQLMTGRLLHLADQLKLTSLLVTVWQYQIEQGKESTLTDRILGNTVKSEFSQGHISHRIATVLARFGHDVRLASQVARYLPNILKLLATHPSTLVEEFMVIVSCATSDINLITETLHSLLDLPALSASVCLHESSLNMLVQAGFKVPVLVSARQQVESDSNLNSVYIHMMRTEAKTGETSDLLKLYPNYWSVLRTLFSLGLVDVCSQVSHLLLQVFLESVYKNKEANKLIFPVLLSRIPLLCPIPAYQKSVYGVLSQYVSKVSSLQPELMELSCISQFLSVSNYCQLCPQLFGSLVEAVGKHVNTGQNVSECFETLEAILHEFLQEKATKDLKLETSLCDSLAMLTCRSPGLIPRAIIAFEKLIKKQEITPGEDEDTFLQHTKELIRILKSPRLAHLVLTPSCKEDSTIASLVKVLLQFTE
ncbi:AP-5 complex subunit zeta-1-like [Macrosteles quadrilineatus]|uniref:AP-5 complex subunit zeta-1-like n=1 Tax=Macrosteles quadrilineatus TaxID=74068 RepID=UPI0023E34C5C|nr:AP-5 complex subunit zeta-1-like [Macrosteles quadrilineatus]